MNSRVGRLGGHSHDSRNLTFLFRSREATTHRVYLNEVDTPLRANLYAKPFASHETGRYPDYRSYAPDWDRRSLTPSDFLTSPKSELSHRRPRDEP